MSNCSFCKSKYSSEKYITKSIKWSCCSNNKCEKQCSFIMDTFMKKNHILSYIKFMELNKSVLIPYYLNVTRSNGQTDSEWIFSYQINEDYFIYWYQGKWLINLMKNINNQIFYKYISIDELSEYNNMDLVKIKKNINNFINN